MDTKIFDRIEKKYLITETQAENILRVVRENMKEDHYHKSEVYNIYFDTDGYDLIVKSIGNPAFKEKLRARSYGGYDKVFLEIKTKMRGRENNVGYKRRVLITHDDYKKLISGKKSLVELAMAKVETPYDRQIASEVDYLINYLKLKPRILVYYDRESYSGENSLRITFDRNLRYRSRNLKFTRSSRDHKYFHTDQNIIMEIKAHGVMPLWLVQTLTKERAFPARFSKIGKIYAQLRKEKNV